jgi:hypothetical protein
MKETEQQPVDYMYGALFPEAELNLVRRFFGKSRGISLEEFTETYQLSIKDPLNDNVGQHLMTVPEGLVYIKISSSRRRLAGVWEHFNHERRKSLKPAEPVRRNLPRAINRRRSRVSEVKSS